MRLRRDAPATIWQHLGAFTQVVAALAVTFNQDAVSRRPGLGEENVHSEALCPVWAMGFPLLRWSQQALTDPPLDVELIQVPLVLHLAPSDHDVGCSRIGNGPLVWLACRGH